MLSLLSPRVALFLSAGISLAILAGAHLFERVGGFPPCALCLDQREVHWAAVAVALLALGISRFAAPERLATAALGTLFLVYVFSAGLASYHAGAEYGFWAGPSGCSSSGPVATEVDLSDLISGAPVDTPPACDEAPWALLGISMAGFNALISAGLAIACALGFGAAVRRWRQERALQGVRIV